VICWWQWAVPPWLGTPGANGKVAGSLRTAARLRNWLDQRAGPAHG
jgi:hypothetical protein